MYISLCVCDVCHFVGDTLYLPTFSESNVWDFCLVMTGISDDFQKTYELSFQSYSKDDSFSMFWFY